MSCCLIMKEKGEARHSGTLFNTHSTDVWDQEKGSCSLYLDELLIQKCKFRQKKGEARHSGQLFNTHSTDVWD